MNLHGIVSPYIAAVNPSIPVSFRASTGSALAPGGHRQPTYADAVTVRAQVQPLQFKDITQLDSLNIQGTRIAIYLYGRADGLVRPQAKGGDLIDIATGVAAGTWLVAVVAEQWPDWVKVLCTLQND
jgi:hypothetical protein